MKLILLALLVASSMLAQCVTAARDQVTAGELAKVDLTWAQVPADEAIAYAPQVGLRRIVESSELKQWGARFGIVITRSVSICIERAKKVWSKREVEDAIGQLDGVRPEEIEILEFSRLPTLPGVLEFRVSDLKEKDDHEVRIWHGNVRTEDGIRTPFWIRVRLKVTHVGIFAAEELLPGVPIRKDQLASRFLIGWAPKAKVSNAAGFVGKIPKRLLKSGEMLYPSLVDLQWDVIKGQVVEVQVEMGAGKLVIHGIAETNARVNEYLLLRNPETGKLYRGVVSGQGLASLPTKNYK